MDHCPLSGGVHGFGAVLTMSLFASLDDCQKWNATHNPRSISRGHCGHGISNKLRKGSIKSLVLSVVDASPCELAGGFGSRSFHQISHRSVASSLPIDRSAGLSAFARARLVANSIPGKPLSQSIAYLDRRHSSGLSCASLRPDQHGRSDREWRYQIQVMRCPK